MVKLPPSSAHIWGAPNGCRGYGRMIAPYRDFKKHPAAEEGKAAHWVASEYLNSYRTAGALSDLSGRKAPNGIVVDAEMLDNVKIYLDDVISVALQSGGTLLVESKTSISKYTNGIVDAAVYDPRTLTLYVWDYKHGRVSVSARENLQMICYAIGILQDISLPFHANINVVLRIVQPRCFDTVGPIDEWRLNALGLMGYVDRLAAASEECQVERPLIRSGKHCRYCDARFMCAAAIEAGAVMYEGATQLDQDEPPVEELSRRYQLVKRAYEQLEYLKIGLEGKLTAMIQSGKDVPGLIVEPKLGRTAWNRPVEEVISMAAMLGVDIKKPGVMTPNQAAKAGLDKNIVNMYSSRKSGGFNLVFDDGSKAKQIFEGK